MLSSNMPFEVPRSRISYRIDWLEMHEPPTRKSDGMPSEAKSATVCEAVDFPVWLFFSLYDAVGDGYHWVDMHLADPEDVKQFLGDREVRMYLMMRDGWPQGFYLLDTRVAGVCDLSYFGLVPRAIGKGLGGWLLDSAIAKAWSATDVRKMTVNTCTLDHPRAKALYESRGFVRVRSENRSRQVQERGPGYRG